MQGSVVYFDLGNTLVFGSQGNYQPFPDAAATISELRSRGYKIGLLSDQPPGTTHADVRVFLDQHGLQSSLIDFITISSDFNPPIYKPAAQIFAAAVSNAGHAVASEKLIFVTETLAHINAARQLGWRGIHKPYQASCTPASGECVGSLSDLLALLPDLEQHGASFKMGSGATVPGATNWQPYGNNSGVYVDVDTSGCGFTSTPRYFTSIGGRSRHWSTTGATSIYNPTPTKFRVYVRWANGGTLTPAAANGRKWHINWFAVEEG